MKSNLLFITLLFFLSCRKENEGEGDSQLPVIMLTTPSNNQSFSAGQTINVTGTVTDNTKIEEIHLEITNTATGAFITHEHYAPDSSSYMLAKRFTAQANASYRIKVEAEDSKGNHAKTEIAVISN